MATLPAGKDVRCTYATCSLSFDSKNAMDVHKTDAEDHFYCSKCDMDFMNHALLHLHKVMSEHHFACLECETEHRSDAGLKHHVKMSHPKGRDVFCVGCGIPYQSAAAVMKHIEEERCPILSLPEKPSHEDNFDELGGEVIMELAENSSKLLPANLSDDEEEGGVRLSLEAKVGTLQESTPGAMVRGEEWPEPGSKETSRRKSGSMSTQSGGGVSLTLAGSVLEQAVATPLLVQPHPGRADRNQRNLSSISIGQRNSVYGSAQNAHGSHADVDPEDFWNEERGRYVCNCNASFMHVSTFIHHIAEEDDSVIECPRCGKRFTTRAAQVAHVEAPFSKCAIRVSSSEMEEELNHITRGFAEIKGHDQLMLEGIDDVTEDTQSFIGNPAKAITDNLRTAPDPIESRIIERDAVGEDSIDDDVLEDALEYITEDENDGSLEDRLVDDLRGLVFSSEEHAG